MLREAEIDCPAGLPVVEAPEAVGEMALGKVTGPFPTVPWVVSSALAVATNSVLEGAEWPSLETVGVKAVVSPEVNASGAALLEVVWLIPVDGEVPVVPTKVVSVGKEAGLLVRGNPEVSVPRVWRVWEMADVASAEVPVEGDVACPPGAPAAETPEVTWARVLAWENDVSPEVPRVVSGLVGVARCSVVGARVLWLFPEGVGLKTVTEPVVGVSRGPLSEAGCPLGLDEEVVAVTDATVSVLGRPGLVVWDSWVVCAP